MLSGSEREREELNYSVIWSGGDEDDDDEEVFVDLECVTI